MKEPLAVPNGEGLVECYESLRQDVLAGGGGGRTLRGRALLMFKGMAAWMQGIGVAPVAARVAASNTPLQPPVGIEQSLVAIVATMAFATAMEDRA
jgi:hypothetical protein